MILEWPVRVTHSDHMILEWPIKVSHFRSHDLQWINLQAKEVY